MNRYYLLVLTGGKSSGIEPYIVEADGFEYGTSGAYRFWSRIDNKVENIAMYPIDRTVIRKIEKINE
jgi:hypothetical protein